MICSNEKRILTIEEKLASYCLSQNKRPILINDLCEIYKIAHQNRLSAVQQECTPRLIPKEDIETGMGLEMYCKAIDISTGKKLFSVSVNSKNDIGTNNQTTWVIPFVQNISHHRGNTVIESKNYILSEIDFSQAYKQMSMELSLNNLNKNVIREMEKENYDTQIVDFASSISKKKLADTCVRYNKMPIYIQKSLQDSDYSLVEVQEDGKCEKIEMKDIKAGMDIAFVCSTKNMVTGYTEAWKSIVHISKVKGFAMDMHGNFVIESDSKVFSNFDYSKQVRDAQLNQHQEVEINQELTSYEMAR